MESFRDNDYSYNGKKVVLAFNRYQANGTLALSLKKKKTGEPYMKITTCIDSSALGAKFNKNKHIFVKNWSENEGIDNWLTENNIAKPTGIYEELVFPSHTVRIPIYELTQEYHDE